jgi:uncharacterized membrane protein
LQPPYHPLFVHFPIALYCLGALLSLAALYSGLGQSQRTDYDRFGYWLFFLSWVAAIVASLVGLVDRGQLAYDDPRRESLDQHVTWGIAFIISNGLVLYMRFRWPAILTESRRWLYVGLILVGVALLALTGWWGGELVYRWQVGIR